MNTSWVDLASGSIIKNVFFYDQSKTKGLVIMSNTLK